MKGLDTWKKLDTKTETINKSPSAFSHFTGALVLETVRYYKGHAEPKFPPPPLNWGMRNGVLYLGLFYSP